MTLVENGFATGFSTIILGMKGLASELMTILFPHLGADAQRYDPSQSYEWNYEHAPPLPDRYLIPSSDTSWSLCGVSVNSPLGIAAGPLLNGRWVLHYASLGFDLLTYKTVRSRAWPCYAPPNLLPIRTGEISGPPDSPIPAAAEMHGSWAVSFGMPSKSPELWRFDVEETRRLLPEQKRLSVSVVATPEPDWTLEQVGEDYAKCARWAVESGADFVELNFSCPNVLSRDGQLYQHPHEAAFVTHCVREQVEETPLLIKIGHVGTSAEADALVEALSPAASALVMINCIPAQVSIGHSIAFDGQRRGIAGPAIYQAVLTQLKHFHGSIRAANAALELIAVGGLSTVEQVEECLSLGAQGVQVATSIMV